MRRLIQCGVVVVSFMVIAMRSAGGTLTEGERAKIHPTFQRLLEQQQRLSTIDGEGRVDAIVYTSDPDAVAAEGVAVNSRFPGFVTAQISPRQIRMLADIETVRYIDPGVENYPALDVSVPETGAALVHGGFFGGTPFTGQNAIVLIYDTGIDWKHLDFRDPVNPSRSRVLAIWDQTLTPISGESGPVGFSYGVEYNKAQIENELDGTPSGVVRERDNIGHGTHVAGIAAGNGAAYFGKYAGMAPGADLIIVKGGETGFSEARMIDALTYANAKGAAFGKPVVVNYSLGGQVGPHDGTRPYETAITSFVEGQGRLVTVSAGNDGNGAIHIGGILAAGASATISMSVPSYTPTAGSGNDNFVLDVWFTGAPSVSATLVSPNGVSFTRNPGEIGDGPVSTDGTMTMDNYVWTANGNRDIYLEVSDKNTVPPRAGTWRLTLNNTGSSVVSYDGWLADRSVGSASVTLVGGDTKMTVGMPGTSSGAITVGAYGTKWSWPVYSGSQYGYVEAERTGNILSFSSIGPTRDGRLKPDIAGPGQGIFSALSSQSDTVGEFTRIAPGQKHILDQGTSMAAPHVAGAAALLLGANPSLTFSELKNLLTASANSDNFATGLPNNTWGYGKLDVVDAMARLFTPSASVTRTTIAYDQPGANLLAPLTGHQKVAVGFAPSEGGSLVAANVNVTSNRIGILGTGSATFEIWTDNNGLPGTKMGSSVVVPLQRMTRGTVNYVQLLDAQVTVTAGATYHLVLSLTTAGDTLTIRNDSLSSPPSTTSWFDGTSWTRWTRGHLRVSLVLTTGGDANPPPPTPVPLTYELAQNYPNPFNSGTFIRFSLPEAGLVSLKVFDVLGRDVATLVNENRSVGKQSVRWVPVNLSSGCYFYRLQAGGFRQTKKLVYVK